MHEYPGNLKILSENGSNTNNYIFQSVKFNAFAFVGDITFLP